jgi:hypothetical protein
MAFFCWGGGGREGGGFLKVIFDKTAFVKFKNSNNKTLMKHIQNNQKSQGKSIPAYGFQKS